MARIRTIKPEFFTSETIVSLPLRARLTFAGLWTYCDDLGRGRDNARLIRAAVWALDDVSPDDVESDLVLLADSGLIERYVVAGRAFIQVCSWSEHQKISHPTRSKIPAPGGELSGELLEDSGDSLEDSGKKLLGTGNREQGTGKGTGKGSAADAAENFRTFWDAYPRKIDKRKAEKAYQAALKRGASPGMILKAAQLYAEDRAGGDLRYVKHPTSWLNAGAYDNDPEPRTGYQPYQDFSDDDYLDSNIPLRGDT